ncbi:MAG: SIMPL domain-containing protein [Xanthobacteraceae bacterium]
MAFARTMTIAGLRAGLLAVCTFAAVASVKAQPAIAPPPPPPLPPARVIVSGEGSVTVPPDYAEITSGVTTQAKTAKQATDANAKAMATVNAALESDGIAANDIQTARFSVAPVYGSPQPNSPPKLTGFSVSNQLAIKVRQIGKLGAVLDSLIAAGATDAGSVQFLHSDASKALDQARQAAIADARRKAELYAQASGLQLGGVAWITEEPAYAPTPTPMLAMRVAAATPIAAGEDTLRVRIIVGFTAAP